MSDPKKRPSEILTEGLLIPQPPSGFVHDNAGLLVQPPPSPVGMKSGEKGLVLTPPPTPAPPPTPPKK